MVRKGAAYGTRGRTMAKPKLTVLMLATALAIAPAPARAGIIFVPPPVQGSGVGGAAFGLIGCVTGILLAAIDASQRFNRELTPAEASSCGMLYWINLANGVR